MLNWPRTSNLTIGSNGFNVAQHFLTQALRHDGELECFMHDGTRQRQHRLRGFKRYFVPELQKLG